MGLSFYDLAALPNQYDIVWCLYPRREDKLAPGPVARPCLVLDVRRDTESNRAGLLVSYGTGNIDSAPPGGDLVIDEWDEIHELGLHKPTRFALSLQSRMLLPWCVEYFIPPVYVRHAGVIAGSLSEKQIERLVECLAIRGLKPFA
jgi:hypothetical protein